MRKNKLLIVFSSILVIGVLLIPALTHAAPAQKLKFYAVEILAQPPTFTEIQTGKVLQLIDYYDVHSLTGIIGEEEITGYTESFFHVINNPAGVSIVNGDSYMYFTWGDLYGYFYGKKQIKVIDGELTGTYSMQGFGDFQGMKLIGIIYGNIIVNTFEATLLIPN